jgi:hypothetical protein
LSILRSAPFPRAEAFRIPRESFSSLLFRFCPYIRTFPQAKKLGVT